jgi:hypothetical protein
MSATLDGLSFEDNGTFADTGNYFQKLVDLGAAKSDIIGYQGAGVQGQGTTNFGYATQVVTIEVMYVDSSYDAVVGNAQGDNVQLGSGVWDATVCGVDFKACKLVAFRTAPEGAKSSGLGTYWLKATITFDALRRE